MCGVQCSTERLVVDETPLKKHPRKEVISAIANIAIQCSPHNSNPLNKNFRLFQKNPGSHRRNNTKYSNGKIRLNRRSKIQFYDSFSGSSCRFFQ